MSRSLTRNRLRKRHSFRRAPISARSCRDAELEALQPETPKDTDLVRVIVELDAPALTEQSGMFAGKALTDAGRTAQQNAIAAQEQVEAKIAEAAPEASVRYSYSLLLNGIALECAYGHIAELEALPGVKAVHMVQTYELPTEPKVTSGGGMIGAPTAWNLGMDGSGMVVAVLDTGLDTDHAAFAADPKTPAVVRGDIDEILSAGTLQAQRLVRDLSSSSVYLTMPITTRTSTITAAPTTARTLPVSLQPTPRTAASPALRRRLSS